MLAFVRWSPNGCTAARRIEYKEGRRAMEAKFVGIDVSKARLDVDCLPVSTARQFSNDAGGIAALVQWLLGSGVERIVVEATGGYEIAVASALAAAGLPVVVVNPKRVRDFAKAQGVLAKSDRLDARVLALFGERIAPPVRALPEAAQRDLTELLDRRHQLVTMRAQEQARLATVLPVARGDVEQHIAWLDQRIRKHETVLLKRLRANEIWDAKVKLLDSVPGIGPVNLFTLVGVAPFNDDSGKRRGQRYIRGGRAEVRCALYMATLTAKRCNPAIAQMFERLIAKGKPFKVAMTACMRKLLTILNAILKSTQPWENRLAT